MTPNTGSGPQWIIFGALVGAAAAISSQFINHWLTRKRDREIFGIETFERFRREFHEDPELRAIRSKAGSLTAYEMQQYLGFFEHVGLYFARGLVDIDLLDEILGDYVIESFSDREMEDFIVAARVAERDPTYFRYFERLGRVLLERKKRRFRS